MNIFTTLRSITLVLSFFFFWNHANSQCLNTQKYVEVIINADQYADIDNTNWTVTNEAGTILASGSPDGSTFCVSRYECVYFNIYDNYGDGLGNGSYQVNYDGNTIASGSNFGSSLSIELGGCDAGISCSNPTTINGDGTYTTNGPDHWYSYTPTITGYHVISTCNINSCNTRIYGYEECSGIILTENQEQTIFFNNNYCDTQSEVNVILNAGTEYFIRIGDTDTNCANTNIQWSVNFQNVVAGCTDPNACNYNPTATNNDGSCIYQGDTDCPDGPDLKILQDVLESTMITGTITNNDNCYVAEGCINGYGSREIIRFTTHIKNIGNQDYYIGSPPADINNGNDQWEYDQCHNHWHYEGYGEYLLFDDNGTEIPIGFKNGFCVLDLECSDGGTAKYTCSNQGISKQCGDYYSRNLACQWIDVTDVADGDYTLVVRVNWDQSPDALGRIETDFTNNWAQVCFNLARNNNGHFINVISNCPAPVDCFSQPFGTAVEDCTGTCGGNAVTGDINANYTLTNEDVVAYNGAIINENIAVTDCNDVAADGEINILDAVLIARCVNDADGNQDGHNHAHCDFPTVAINNNTQSACFSLGNLNTNENYFDILIENPDAHVTAYNLDLNGVTITSLSNLETGYNSDLKFDNSGEIVSVSYNLDNIARYNTPTPILRVYYSNATTICLNEVIDVVNEYHELISNCIDGTCLTIPSCTDNDNDGYCEADDCDDNNPNLPTTPDTPCNDNNSNTTNDIILADGCTCQGTPIGNNTCVADFSVAGSSVTISGLTNPVSSVKIIFPDYTTYWECNSWDVGCNATEIINDIPDGDYIISLNTYTSGWSSICNIFESFTIGGGGCIDNDNDGICAPSDCNDNDANLPATPGTNCNDGNPNTINDVIQSDGCTCQGTDNSNNNCEAEFIVTGNSVSFTGLTNPINAVKIINLDYSTYWECNSWEDGCNTTEVVNNIPNGDYYISLNTYDASWNSICNLFEALTIGVTECTDNDNDGICVNEDCDDNNPNLPTTVGSSCNDNNSNTENDVIQSDGCTCQGTVVGTGGCDATYSVSGAQVVFENLNDPVNAVKVIEQNSYTTVWECNSWDTGCNVSEATNSLPAGNYIVSLNTYDAGWNSICNIYDVVTVSGGNCPDADDDGTCDTNDCAPTDASLPATPGTACNDFDATTENDVIQSDGCTCAGTPPSNCNASYSINGNAITISDLTDPINAVKIINLDYTTYWECNTWNTACDATEIINNIPSGDYYISLNTYDAGWNVICNVFDLITITGQVAPIPTAIEDIETEFEFNLYPNPVKDLLTIEFRSTQNHDIYYELLTTQGISIVQNKVSLNENDHLFFIQTDLLANGYYLLKVRVGDKIMTKPIIKLK